MSETNVYPEPPEALVHPRARHLAAYLGPGVILASVTIGSGELVWASRSGAIFGYGLLWCFLYAGVFKAIQVYSAARHITLTGEHPMVAWGELPGPRFWFPLLIAVPAVAVMPIAFSAIPETLGGYVHRLVGIAEKGEPVAAWNHLEWWTNVWSTAVLTFCVALALGSGYRLLERVSTVVLAAMVVCVGVAVVVFRPNLIELFEGLVVPRAVEYPQWILSKPEYAKEFAGRSRWLEISIYLTAVGGGAYDYIGYIGMLREKRWGLAGRRVAAREELAAAVAENVSEIRRRARLWSRAPLLDIGGSFLFVILVTLLFAILGTLVLHEKAVIPKNDDLLTAQQQFLTELHPELRWLYRTGVFLAFIGTLYGAFEVYRHTFAESVTALLPHLASENNLRLLRGAVVAYCFAGGLVMIWLPESLAGNIVNRLTLGSVISGATSCGLWCFAMLWADRVRLPPALRMGRSLWVAVLIAGLALTGLGVKGIVEYFAG